MIEDVTAFKSLMLQTILNLLCDDEVGTNHRDKIWLKTSDRIETFNQQKVEIHKAIYLSFFFDNHEKYAFLTFKPTIHIIGYTIDEEKRIKRLLLEEATAFEFPLFDNGLTKREVNKIIESAGIKQPEMVS